MHVPQSAKKATEKGHKKTSPNGGGSFALLQTKAARLWSARSGHWPEG